MGLATLLLVGVMLVAAAGPRSSSAAADLPPCKVSWKAGQATLAASCSWQEQAGRDLGAVTISSPPSGGVFPIVVLPSGAESPTKVTSGFSLSLQRVTLSNAVLSSPTGAPGVPKLLPLGLFATAPTNLTLVDVRVIVSTEVFKEYLAFFSKYTRSVRTADDGGLGMHTDGVSFLNIPTWSDASLQVYSVSLLAGPCSGLATLWAGATGAAGRRAPQAPPGCNLLIADNSTLIALLRQHASISTPQPLVLRIMSNVTLGPNLNGTSLPIRRPVLLLGLASVPTSVDLGMVVNQLNVTAPGAQLAWQSLVLENLAPGDTTSSLIAPPYSTATSTNLWAVYCNRSADLCVPLVNVTMVIPTAREVNYHLLMFTLFKSGAESLHQLAGFMATDLGVKDLQFVAGPGNDTMTILHILGRSWHFRDVVTTTQPLAAAKLPVPERPFTLSKSGPAPLVQAIQDCSSFQTATMYNSSRVFVWRLINNISIANHGRLACAWPSRQVAAPTHLFGQVIREGTSAPAAGRASTLSAIADAMPGLVTPPDSGGGGGRGSTDTEPPWDSLYSLSFGFAADVFQLPRDAPDRFLQIQNVTLAQLPQQRVAGAGRRRRLLRGLSSSSATPPGVWAVLLWPFQRSLSGMALAVMDSQLLLPEPEWQLLADTVRVDDSFTMQLQGAVPLALTGAAIVGNNAIRVAGLQGPGIIGSNLWLLPDASAASSMPGGYVSPAATAAGLHTSGGGGSASAAPTAGGLSAAAQAAVGGVLGAAGALLLALGACLLLRRHRRRHALQQKHRQVAGNTNGAAADPCGGGGLPSPAASLKKRDPASGNVLVSSLDDDAPSRHHPDTAAAPLAADAGHSGSAVTPATAVAAAAAGVTAVTSSRSDAAGRTATMRPSPAAPLPQGQEAADVCVAGDAGTSPTCGTVSSQQRLQQSIADGMSVWATAVSSTTMQLMQRRLRANHLQNHMMLSAGGSSSSSSSKGPGSAAMPAAAAAATAAATAATGGQEAGAACVQGGDGGAAPRVRSSDTTGPAVQLLELIGEGSYGSVFLARWQGKECAVKVMQLPASGLGSCAVAPGSSILGRQQQQSGSGQAGGAGAQSQLQRQMQQNSPPHMALMEAVLSSAMQHPNVVQVFAHMLTPLMMHPGGSRARTLAAGPGGTGASGVRGASGVSDGATRSAVASASGSGGGDREDALCGFQLRIVMEYCNQGTLREALDRQRLPRLPGATFLQPQVVLSLSHDIAAAMVHLHSEGIVHGDLKAANCLLTVSTSNNSSSLVEVWTAAGCLPLTAKVADFGLALPLGPTDTHATMLARGTPTHMSPELFMDGHVSKASDVYAYGILLYEILTGLRAFAGVPVPLLPHQVAVAGLRPVWPQGLPAACRQLQQLAEACWAQQPTHRPSFLSILQVLEDCTPAQMHTAASDAPDAPASGMAPPPPSQQEQEQQEQQQQPPKQPRHVVPMRSAPQPQPHAKAPPQADSARQATAAAATPDSHASRHSAGLAWAGPLAWSEVSYGSAADPDEGNAAGVPLHP